MKTRFFFAAVFFFIAGVFSVNAREWIVLSDGKVIEAKVLKISASEISYKRLDNLEGPPLVITRDDVYSIRYDNGSTKIINRGANPKHAENKGSPGVTVKTSSPKEAGDAGGKKNRRQSDKKPSIPQLGEPTLLQQALNLLPAIPIMGKTLKFEFGGDIWIAKVNGNNFLAGDCIFEENGNGYILTLKTTNVWTGAVEEVIDLLQKAGVPLGPAATPLRTAAKLATRLAKWVPIKGSAIILEYNEDTPAKISFVKMEK
jgi:hypothetical protein